MMDTNTLTQAVLHAVKAHRKETGAPELPLTELAQFSAEDMEVSLQTPEGQFSVLVGMLAHRHSDTDILQSCQLALQGARLVLQKKSQDNT
jgi:hypothetical protein